MSNTTVPANAEGMPKFDRAAVMRLAWEIYRKRFGGERDAARRRWAFSLSLKSAWMTVKWEAKEAAKSAEQKRADEIAALRLEVLRIAATPFRMRLDNDRYDRLQQQISALQRAA